MKKGDSVAYSYTGYEQAFTATKSGTYKLEAWGAKGGDSEYHQQGRTGGMGGYSYGTVTLSANQTIYITVGGTGDILTAGYPNGGSGGASGSWAKGGGGGGGSSFISGYEGCNAISAESTENNIIHTNQPNHYSGKVFVDTVMKAGDEEMPTHDGTGTMTGNSGNGYARITYLG